MINVFYVTVFVLKCKIMQHLCVNLGSIWRFELGFLYLFFA